MSTPASAALPHGLKACRRQRFQVEIEQKLVARTAEVFGTRTMERLSGDKENVANELQFSVAAQLDRGRLGYATARVHDQLLKLAGKTGPITSDVKAFLTDNLGQRSMKNSFSRLDGWTRWPNCDG